MQLTKIFLHTGRLKLERSDGLSLLIEFVCLRVIDRNGIQIYIDASCSFDIGTCLLQLRECLQSEEVHLDKSCRLDDMSVILCTVGLHSLEIRVIGSRYRHMVADRITADDESTGMDTRSSHRSLKHLRIFDGICESRVCRSLCLLEFPGTLDGIGEIHLQVTTGLGVFQSVGDSLTQGICQSQGHLLHTGHILDGVLRSHSGIGDDMCTVLMAVLILHPFQYLSSSVVIEVGIDIRQRDTVWVKETLKQQVVFQGVDLCDSQTISHHRTGSRTTSRPNHHSQLIAGRVDKVLHDKEVAGESHRLHDVQFELHSFYHILWYRFAISALCSFIGEFSQIVGLELYAVYLVVASQFLDFLLGIFRWQWVLAVLVGSKLLIELLLGELLPPLFLGTELLRNGEERHDRVIVETVDLHLI